MKLLPQSDENSGLTPSALDDSYDNVFDASPNSDHNNESSCGYVDSDDASEFLSSSEGDRSDSEKSFSGNFEDLIQSGK